MTDTQKDELRDIKKYEKIINKGLPKTFGYDFKLTGHKVRIASVLGKLTLSVIYMPNSTTELFAEDVKDIADAQEKAISFLENLI